ncbi:hypothetical protein NL676_020922 [Syzygium grande]|nr:hypothetical protein NL676_020922 [Syzygium grande]
MSRPSPEIHPPLRHPPSPSPTGSSHVSPPTPSTPGASSPAPRMSTTSGSRSPRARPRSPTPFPQSAPSMLSHSVSSGPTVRFSSSHARNYLIVRHRCLLLSEKMRPSETPEMAVIRAVREELGSVIWVEVGNIGDVVRIVPGSYKMKVDEKNSISYPGLPARYIFHSFEVEVEGQPEDAEFCTEEEEEYEGSGDAGVANRAVSVKRHYWKWVSADSVES